MAMSILQEINCNAGDLIDVASNDDKCFAILCIYI